jgi:hypothetical protein
MGDECEKMHFYGGYIHSIFDRVINIETDTECGIDNLFSLCLCNVPPAPARLITDSDASWLLLGLQCGQKINITYGDVPVWRGITDYTIAQPQEILRRLALIQYRESDSLKNIAYNDAEALIGRGLGLTPSGDDFLAGVLYSLYFLKRADLLEPLSEKVKNLLDRTTRLSRHFLNYALAGRWGQTEQALLSALMTDNGGALDKAVDNMLVIGSSSGADELSGIAAGIRAALGG